MTTLESSRTSVARVLLLGGRRPPEVHRAFGSAATLGSDALLTAAPSLDTVPEDLDPEVLVVAAHLADARHVAATFRRRHPGAQILFLVEPERVERFRASLPFAPDLAGASVLSSGASEEDLRRRLTELVATARRERNIGGLYDRLNSMLRGERSDAHAERQRQLVLAERYLATLLRHSPLAVFATDVEGQILHVNAAAERLFGRTEGGLLELFAPESRPAVERLIRSAASGGYPDPVEVALQGSGRDAAWVQLQAAPVHGAARIEGLSFSASDITARRRAEREFAETAQTMRTLANAIPQLAWMADAAGQVEWYNDRWYDYTGIRPEQALGSGWTAVLPPDHLERVLANIGRHLASGAPWEDRFPMRGKDGGYRWFLARALPLHAADGRIVRWIGSNTDITDQLEVERSLREINETLEQRVAERTRELQATNRELVRAMQRREEVEERVRQMQKLEAVGQLTGGIAHDFNNMLAVIINALEVITLYQQRGRTDVQRFIDAALNAGRRAATLTQSLLAFARKQPLSPQAVNANRLIEGMAELLRSTLRENIRIHTAFQEDLWLTHVDPNQLENAILNLAVNCRDAMPEGGRVTLETANERLDAAEAARLDCAPGEYVSVAVTDTGHGMTPEVAERAFDPFYTTKEVGQGTGLGLSQVLGFVKQSGGHVGIRSTVGRGTTVKLYLPAFQGDAQPVRPAPPVESPQAPGHELILLVEDDDGVRELTRQVLLDLGYRVVEAAGPLAALRLLDEHPEVELLLTDVVMPEMNGRRLADEALRRRPDMKVLFTSGYPRDAVVHNGVLDPGVNFLPKPATAQQLATKLRAVLRK